MSNYGHCHYCRHPLTKPTATNHGRRMATRDHIIPASRGGVKTVPCCFHCNNLKADMMPDEWMAWRSRNPNWHDASFRPRTAAVEKAIQRAEIFQRLRIQRIQPAWPDHVHVARRPLCRGLAA